MIFSTIQNAPGNNQGQKLCICDKEVCLFPIIIFQCYFTKTDQICDIASSASRKITQTVNWKYLVESSHLNFTSEHGNYPCHGVHNKVGDDHLSVPINVRPKCIGLVTQ